MSQKVKFPNINVPARKIQASTTIIGKNGLPIDSLATIEPGIVLKKGSSAITYDGAKVTFDVSVDLSAIAAFGPKQAKLTGFILFTDSDGNGYFVNPTLTNIVENSIRIFTDAELTIPPNSIVTGGTWMISEAELVNRLQTTTSAVVDSVEFRDIEVKLQLDGSQGDSVRIVDKQNDQLDINADGSINTIDISYDKILDVVLKSNWLKTAVYDRTELSRIGNTITVNFYEDTFVIGTAVIDFQSKNSWSFHLFRYILDDDGTQLLDDNDEPLFLE